VQPYGVRNRVLGGSTHSWAGKSAAFDAIDFEQRPWVPHSGWPIGRRELDSYLDRAAEILNLGPNCYDERLWTLAKLAPPQPPLRGDSLRPFFWQFARSRIDPLDIMRFGKEFLTLHAENVRVLLNATVTQIRLADSGSSFDRLEISTLGGVRSKVKARVAILAASAIENARLLLASRDDQPAGIGNARDLVGRFLMDHVGCQIGHIDAGGIAEITNRFGFYGVRAGGRTQMYMHGLALSDEFQRRHELLNAAVYFMPQRSPHDPWDALKRVLRRDFSQPLRDVASIVGGTGLLAKGIGMKVLSSDRTPGAIKDFIINTAIRYNPNLVAQEFLGRGVPHKVVSVGIDAITEQRPDPESRIVLSEGVDGLGVPLPRVNWRINSDERRTLVAIAQLTRDCFARSGLPVPVLEPWVTDGDDGNAAAIIDMAHTLGTTRMSDDPASGVVDRHCAVHGIRGLYVAGGSTFPTSGHANPTLMIVALAIRLADRLKALLASPTA
jgi:choline dehydrogenase-like flavoprotein